jgi:hypothetical protein
MKKEYIVGGLAILGGLSLLAYFKSKPRRNSQGFFNALGSNKADPSSLQQQRKREVTRLANLVRSEINAVNNSYSYDRRIGALKNALSLVQQIYLNLLSWGIDNQGIMGDYLLLTIGRDKMRLVCPQWGVAQGFNTPTSYLGLLGHITNLTTMFRATIVEPQFPDGTTLTPSQIPAQNQRDQQFLSLFNSWINRTNVWFN